MLRRHLAMIAACCIIIVITAIVGPAGVGLITCEAGGEDILGPPVPVAVIDDFIAGTKDRWQLASGSNVRGEIRTGYGIPGVSSTLLKMEVARQNLADNEPSQNWVSLERRSIAAGTIPKDADGLRILVGTQKSAQWWLSFSLTLANGKTYSHVVDEVFPTGMMVELIIPVEEFKGNDESLHLGQLGEVRSISIAASVPGTTLYLDKISAYRCRKYKWWLDYQTSHPSNNLFQPNDKVSIAFTLGGKLPKTIKSFRYEIRDYRGGVIAQKVVPFTDSTRYTVNATPKTHGYYEVRAYPLDAAGRTVENRSCIRSEGSVPSGLGTFSVLPVSIGRNIVLFEKLKSEAFFGLHGDYAGLADAMGLTWRFGYTMWPWTEPEKPDRTDGEPSWWASSQIAEGPQPDYRFHILPFRGNMAGEVPEWAKRSGGGAPPFENWDDYLSMIRDYVKVEKALYPHMKPRIYGGAWEINLNMAPYIAQQPEFTPEDVVELYQRTRQVVKAEDKNAIIIGPCPSVLDMAWYETVFKAGILANLDAIETHGYCEYVFTPEENDFPAKIAQLNELMRKYNNGKALPIYCTEGGFPGAIGSEKIYSSQAQRMTRQAIILKGEGVKVFLPFYGIDYDKDEMGFLFNLEIESNPWSTSRVSPKPMVNAIAACAGLLEGTVPRGRILNLGDDVWAYSFERPGSTITAVWTTGEPKKVVIPIAAAVNDQVEVIDAMGHVKKSAHAPGSITVMVDGWPQYVVNPSSGE